MTNWTAEIEYIGNLRVQSQHLKSGEKIITDAPTDNYGKGEAFSPTDLMATSLVNCMITLMGIHAEKNKIPFTECQAKLSKVMQDKPRKISQIIIEFEIKNHQYTVEEKNILEKAALECPVALSLDREIDKKISFNYI
jgi:putative redox protein